MTSIALGVLACMLRAQPAEAAAAIASEPMPAARLVAAPGVVPGPEVATPGADAAALPPATSPGTVRARSLGTTVRALGALGTSRSDSGAWHGYGGALALDMWSTPPPGSRGSWAARVSLEGGEYGGAASAGVLVAYGDAAIRPYLAGTIGLGVFAEELGIPVTLGGGVELALPWRFSVAVEGRAHLFGYEDDEGNQHGFGAISVLAGVGVRL